MRITKIVLALVGLGLAVVGEKLDNQIMVYVAMAFLAGAIVLRFAERRKG